jgi:protein-S-isoprenylcysteine O-methyltransferase
MDYSISLPPSNYTILVTICYWIWIGFEVWLLIRERGTTKAGSQDRGSRGINIAAWVLGTTLGIYLVPVILPQFSFRGQIIELGIVLILVGLILRFWAVQALGRFFRTTVVVQDQHVLITNGPYKTLRNPSYTGGLITFLGFGIAVGNWMSILILFVSGIIPYVHRIAIEDRALAAEFGDEYDEYRKKTWALIPYIW